jgi:hypothetical protein
MPVSRFDPRDLGSAQGRRDRVLPAIGEAASYGTQVYVRVRHRVREIVQRFRRSSNLWTWSRPTPCGCDGVER